MNVEKRRWFSLGLFVLAMISISFLLIVIDTSQVSAVTTQCSSVTTCNSAIAAAATGDIVQLTQSISGVSGTAINFAGYDGITFDCNGYSISGTGTGYGVLLNSINNGSNNNTVENCNISDFNMGISTQASNNTIIKNVISTYSGSGFDLGGFNETYINITANHNTQYGVFFEANSFNNSLSDVTANSNPYGIQVYGGSYGNYLNNLTLRFNTNAGLSFYTSFNNTATKVNSNSNGIGLQFTSSGPGYHSVDNIIFDSQFYNNTYEGLSVYSSPNNTIYDNIFNNTINYWNSTTGNITNYFNTTLTSGTSIIGGPYLGGNYWDNYSAPGTLISGTCTDADRNGICDSSYALLDGVNLDYLPLTVIIPETVQCNSVTSCNNAITNATAGDTVQLNTSLTGLSATAISLSSITGITFDCAGYWINGTNTASTYGIYTSGGSNDTIENCNVGSFYTGVYTVNTVNSTLNNITSISNTQYGLLLSGLSNSLLENSSASSNGLYGIQISGNDNQVNNIRTRGNSQYGLTIYQSSLRNVLNNISSYSDGDAGINLDQNTNGTLLENSFVNGSLSGLGGVVISYTSNVTVLNTESDFCSNKGFYLQSNVNNITLINVTAKSNAHGIFVSISPNVTIINSSAISNSKFSTASTGIYIHQSPGAVLSGNNMSNNTGDFSVDGSVNSDFNSTIDTSNIINYNKVLYYNYSVSNYVFDATTAPNAGEVVCVACDNITVKDLNVGYSGEGIYFYGTNSSRIQNVTATHSTWGSGVFLEYSNYNNVTNTTIRYSNVGVELLHSTNNTLSNVYSELNSNSGLWIYQSNNNSFNNLTLNSNTKDGIYFYSASNNTLNSIVSENNTRTGLYLSYAANNTFSNMTIANTIGATYYLSQLESGSWNQVASHHFPIKYGVFSTNLTNTNGNITLQITHNDTEFADIDELRLMACGANVTPSYAFYTDNNESVLNDIIKTDNNVTSIENRTLQISWTVPSNCSENATLYMTANEYDGSPYYFEAPIRSFAPFSSTFSSLISGLTEDKIRDIENKTNYSYSVYWEPGTGHPDGTTYVYTGEDSSTLYFVMDIGADNTKDTQDWAKVLVTNGTQTKTFLINSTYFDYGECGFGMSWIVNYNHAMCLFEIPKSDVGSGNLGYKIEYYGTTAPSIQPGTGIFLDGTYSYGNIITSSRIVNNTYGFALASSLGSTDSNNSFYNNFFNNSVNYYNPSTTVITYFNTTLTAGTNILGGPNIGGNYWANYTGNGFSETCTDADNNSICDSNYSLGSGTYDFLPLTGTIDYPVITIVSPVSQTYTSGSILFNITATDANSTVTSCSYSLNSGSSIALTNSGDSYSATNSSVPTGSYSVTFICTNAKGFPSSATTSFTVSISSTTPPAGTPTGSSGGGTTVAGTTTTTGKGFFGTSTSSAVFTNITAGVPVTVYTNSSSVPLTSLTVTTNTNVTNATVNTSAVPVFSAKDMKIATSAFGFGSTYQSFQINTQNINDSVITQVVINFTVNTSWIVQKKIDPTTVALYRNVGGGFFPNWTALPTTVIGNDSQYYYFSAVSPGFSQYTIYGVTPNPAANTFWNRVKNFFSSLVPSFFRQTSWSYVFYYVIVVLILGGIVFVVYNLFNRFRNKGTQNAWKEANQRKSLRK